MGEISDALYGALVTYLRNRDVPATGITRLEQDTRNDGGCETCSYEYTVIEISYKTSGNGTGVYEYRGDMGELIRELDDDVS